MLSKKQTALAVSAILGLSINAAYAMPITTTGNNFTMLDTGNGLVGGTNDVTFTWDGSYNTDPDTAVTNATLSSPSIFFGSVWTAYNIKIYAPGTYTLSTADTLGEPGCTFSVGFCHSGGDYNVSVGPNQVMGHMKFAWGNNEGIDLVSIWNHQEVFGPSPIWAGVINYGGSIVDLGEGDPNQIWDGMSVDGDSDGRNGVAFIDGPFPGFTGNFNIMGITPVPVPAAVWLFGSGLLGLLGVARRKKKS